MTALAAVTAVLSCSRDSGEATGPAAGPSAAPPAVEVTGRVSAVDLDQVAVDGPARIRVIDDTGEERLIAVPSMGLRLCAAFERIASPWDAAAGDRVAVRGASGGNGDIVPCASPGHYLELTGSHVDELLDYRFDYRKGPDGYLLVPGPAGQEEGALTDLTLFRRAEYEEARQATQAREGPPSFRVRVLDNDRMLWPAVWTLRNPGISNLQLALAEPAETVVGGANAVTFVADGLWPMETFVVANDSKIWLLQGMLPDAQRQADFAALVASLEFIP